MTPAPAPGALADGRIALCAGSELAEAGSAVEFDVLLWRRPARAFALRFEGRVRAYLNRCAHVPTEMQARPGEFLDADRRFIVCSMHGAVYEPTTGRCIAGPCRGEWLAAIPVVEEDGRVYWYPSPDIGPVGSDGPSA